MNPKITQLQQRHAQARLLKRYAFLGIEAVQGSDGEIARRFVDSGIYRIDRPVAAAFPVHENGIINRAL